MNTKLSFSVAIAGVVLLLYWLYLRWSPKVRIAQLQSEIFFDQQKSNGAFTPGEPSWSTGHGLAVWQQRGSRSYVVVMRGRKPGSNSFFEPGIGRMTILNEYEELEDALLSLLRQRQTKEDAEQALRHSRALATAEAEEQRHSELERKRRHWSQLEQAVDSFFDSQAPADWRPVAISIPDDISLDEAWTVVSLAIDELLESLQSDSPMGQAEIAKTLTEGFIGAIDWTEDDDRLNEALIWHALFSLLSERKLGGDTALAILTRFANLNRWDFAAVLIIVWGKLAPAAGDKQEHLRSLAVAAVVKHWRLSHPLEFLTGTMPTKIEEWIESPLKNHEDFSLDFDLLTSSSNYISRINRFVALVCP